MSPGLVKVLNPSGHSEWMDSAHAWTANHGPLWDLLFSGTTDQRGMWAWGCHWRLPACLGDGRNIRDGERKPTEKQPTETIWNSNDYFLPLAPSCIFSLFSLFCCSLSKACCSISKVSLSLGSSGYIDFGSACVSESGTKISYVTKLNLVSKWDFIKLHYR